jgi:hypothetical protein
LAFSKSAPVRLARCMVAWSRSAILI